MTLCRGFWNMCSSQKRIKVILWAQSTAFPSSTSYVTHFLEAMEDCGILSHLCGGSAYTSLTAHSESFTPSDIVVLFYHAQPAPGGKLQEA